MVVEQWNAKTIANTKVPPIGSTTQDAKIAPKSLLLEQVKKTSTNMSTLQGNRGTSRCEDHCKYEGTAVWQYVSGCKDCGQLLLAEYVEANSLRMVVEQLHAKTFANTKVPPIGSTTQDAKIAENRRYSNR